MEGGADEERMEGLMKDGWTNGGGIEKGWIRDGGGKEKGWSRGWKWEGGRDEGWR